MVEGVRWKLGGMMALVYSVQGAFWPLLGVHLKDQGITGRGRGWIFATLAIASLATPLGAGQLADRRMPTQRLLSLIFAFGAALLALLASGAAREVGSLFAIFLIYWLLIAPAYGLSNSLAFRNLPRPGDQFGSIRLWGTVGWMVVGWAVSIVMAWSGSTREGQGAYEAFWVAAGLAAVFSVYCLSLPNTPPLAVSGDRADFGQALAIVRRPSMAVFLAAAFGISLTTPFQYQVIPSYLESLNLSRAWIATAMTLGQMPEIAALAVLPWLLRRFGYRRTLALGIASLAARYGMLAMGSPLWLALAGMPLHGISIACFIVTGQLYLDRHAPSDRRASAQALYVVITSGIGSLLGNIMAGEIIGQSAGDYRIVFLVPCLIDLAMLALILRWFRMEQAEEPLAGHAGGPELGWLRSAARVGLRPESLPD